MTEPWLLGRYEIVAELGKGAMGVVYRANDPMLNRMVAIKTINTEEAGHEAWRSTRHASIPKRRPRAASTIRTSSSSTTSARADTWCTWRWNTSRAASCASCSPRGSRCVVQAVDVAAQVAEGLAYAHQHQVVHRDIKPANIMITPQGRAKIADFGIARMRSSETRTQTGVILGSPKYISPEQVVGKRADHRSDIFSSGSSSTSA